MLATGIPACVASQHNGTGATDPASRARKMQPATFDVRRQGCNRWSGSMVMLKVSAFGAGLVLAASLSAQAASPSPVMAREPMLLAQAAPEPTYSSTQPERPKPSSDSWIPATQATAVARSPERYPGPKVGPSNWIPAAATPAPAANGGYDRGAHPYSQHGTGPYPN
jgi:hypothetical protein